MKSTRREFIKKSTIIGTGIASLPLLKKIKTKKFTTINSTEPMVVATWNVPASTEKAIEMLNNSSIGLDAIEEGIKIAENDPENTSVGYGGYPDEDGIVSLDASIMDWNGNAGAVAFVQNIKNPISVARLVMETTNHVMLVGEGAENFAYANGFKKENLLTAKSREEWLKWKRNRDSKDFWKDNHDTIGMLAIDKNQNISGGVSTSGAAFKIHGRVGDSPIIGAALYLDNNVGGAVATGLGEWAIKSCGSFLIVEKMREGYSPTDACKFAIKRVMEINKKNEKFQLAFLALNKEGEVGAYAIENGFNYMVGKGTTNKNFQSDFWNR